MRVWLTLGIGLVTALWVTEVNSHCQVPCGIYGDKSRVDRMREHVRTIDKAMKKIKALAKRKDAQSKQQLVRWVMVKEQHAEKIIRSISDYFLTQRVKPKQPKYVERLVRHHAVMLGAMKCKQTVDRKQATSLDRAIQKIAGYYPH